MNDERKQIVAWLRERAVAEIDKLGKLNRSDFGYDEHYAYHDGASDALADAATAIEAGKHLEQPERNPT